MIRFEAVTKTYGDTEAVRELTLEVPPRTCTVLVGSSGCGKTTLMRMVNRMVTPTAGRVTIDGEDVAAQDPVRLRRGIGYVLQAAGLLPHRTVWQNVATVPMLDGMRRQEARERALELLTTVGLDASLADRHPHQLSGGQQQRVGVARALAADPNILLMDEPFGAVDPIVRIELQRETRRLQRDLGKTVLFVTHDIQEAFALADEVVVLQPGATIAQRGTPAEIVASPANDFVREFIGANDRARALRIERIDGTDVVVDGSGRPVGTLAEDGSP